MRCGCDHRCSRGLGHTRRWALPAQAFTSRPAHLGQIPPRPPADQDSVGGGGRDDGGQLQLCWHRLWLLPQRRKWAACGHGAKVLEGGWGSNQFLCPRSVSAHSGVAGLWRLGGKQGTSPRAVCTLSKAWAQGEICPSEVFPEAHFPWAAQEVVSEWD